MGTSPIKHTTEQNRCEKAAENYKFITSLMGTHLFVDPTEEIFIYVGDIRRQINLLSTFSDISARYKHTHIRKLLKINYLIFEIRQPH